MSTLYLFGNGFDIAHGIKTPYSAFRNFLKENHEDFLTSFEAMYHIQPLDDTEPWHTETAQQRWDLRVLKDLWEYFEEEMGMPDDSGMYDAALSLVDSMPDCGIKDTLDYHWRREYSFAADLQKYVLEWLETIDTSGAKCKKLTLMNANSDYFMNFNYTDTLEKVYGIKDVLHIHGGVTSCCDISPIMGHGNKYIIDSNQRKAYDYLIEGIEWAASIHEAIARFCYSLYKDTDLIISQNEDFFSNLQSVDEIVTLGLSFGNVDIPYLDRILNAINPTTKWTVYYYSPEDKIRLKEVFGILGITRKYEVYFLESKYFWDA